LDSAIEVGAVVRVDDVPKDGVQLPIRWGEVVARVFLALRWLLGLALGGGVGCRIRRWSLCRWIWSMGSFCRGVGRRVDFPRRGSLSSLSIRIIVVGLWRLGGRGVVGAYIVVLVAACVFLDSLFVAYAGELSTVLVWRLLIGGFEGGLDFCMLGFRGIVYRFPRVGSLGRFSPVGLGCRIESSNLACHTADSRGSVAAIFRTYTVAAVPSGSLAFASLRACGVACAGAAVVLR